MFGSLRTTCTCPRALQIYHAIAAQQRADNLCQLEINRPVRTRPPGLIVLMNDCTGTTHLSAAVLVIVSVGNTLLVFELRDQTPTDKKRYAPKDTEAAVNETPRDRDLPDGSGNQGKRDHARTSNETEGDDPLVSNGF